MSVNIKGVMKGAAISLIITFILLLLLSLIAYLTSAGEDVITICAYGAVILGVLAGSFLVARGAPNKKFAHVALMCLVYTVVLVAASFAANGRIMFNAHTAAVTGGIFAAAFLGLIIGNKQ